ncbi:MAG: molybdenum cofactor biosynthesis protein MoaE [Desulfobulbaceae bacterium]|nr:molybdenum cofactor biosynthesis protein MoaE [Desulfobulbaceae bacterium]
MDITKTIAHMKENPEFAANVGMILAHNGVVRGWSRADREKVEFLEVVADQNKIEAIRQEQLKREGIFDIKIEARSGRFQPGDDLLFIVVAGDFRENVKAVLSDTLEKIKTEGVAKKEIKI